MNEKGRPETKRAAAIHLGVPEGKRGPEYINVQYPHKAEVRQCPHVRNPFGKLTTIHEEQVYSVSQIKLYSNLEEELRHQKMEQFQ